MGDVSKYVDEIEAVVTDWHNRVADIIRRAQAEARKQTLRECGNAIDVEVELLSELDWNHADAVRCARQWIREADAIEAGGANG